MRITNAQNVVINVSCYFCKQKKKNNFVCDWLGLAVLGIIFLISAECSDYGCRTRDYQLLADFGVTSKTLPRPCVNLLAKLPVDSDAADILVALILYIFHECGFVMFDEHIVTSIPTYWGYTNVTQIPETYSTAAAACIIQEQQRHLSSPNSQRSYTAYLKLLNFSEERLVLVIRKIVSGDALCISFCFRDRNESICLPVIEYIHDATTIELVRRSPIRCLKNMATLVTKVKASIITPIRNGVMSSAGLRFPSLIGLPREILWQLMKRLDLISLQNISHTCTYMRNETRIYLDENHIRVTSNRRPTPIVRLPSNYAFPRPDLFRFNYYSDFGFQ